MASRNKETIRQGEELEEAAKEQAEQSKRQAFQELCIRHLSYGY